MQFWNELEGQTIDGLFPLRRLIRSEGRSAWFETETPAPQAGRATISLTEALTDADEITARLEAAQRLKHPHLVEIAQVGQVSIDNTQVVYAVMEPIEQSLSDVLGNQALSPEEGREVAEALVSALTAIHQSGMSHGHVEAASVLATEEKVKLRSDCLQTSATSQAEDVVGIGSTLFHAFTQRKAANATDAQVNRIPAPFGEIVRNALARRWSLAQISNALRPTPPVAVPVATPVAPPPVARRPEAPPVKAAEATAATAATAAKPSAPTPAPPARPEPPPPTPATAKPAAPAAARVPVAPPAPAPTVPPAPAAASQAPLFPEAYEPAAGTQKGKRPVALYGAIAVVVLAILGWLLLRHPNDATPAQTSQATDAAPQTPVAAPAPKPSAVPANNLPHTPAAAPAETSAPSRSAARTIWRVVVYTYRGQSKADASVAKIKGAHPDLDPGVFNPQGSDVYMVILGGAMDRPHASAMLQKARQEGLPQDTFIRNFAQ